MRSGASANLEVALLDCGPVNTLPDVRGTRPGVDRLHEASAASDVQTATAIPVTSDGIATPVAQVVPLRTRLSNFRDWAASLDTRWRYPLFVFVSTRVLYLVLAGIDHFVRTGKAGHHWSLGREVSNWDGSWYVAVA